MRILNPGRKAKTIVRNAGTYIGGACLALSVLAIPSQTVLAAGTKTVVTGKVTSAGHAVSGAMVILYAWPRQAVLDALPQGADVPRRVVGSAVSDSAGEYAINVSNWNAVRASADGEVVNLQVMARSGIDGWSFDFPRLLVNTASGPMLAVDSETRIPSMIPQHADLSLVRGRPDPGCPDVKVKFLGKRWTIVGMTSSKVAGVSMHFTYGSDQSSSLGVGFKLDEGGASWSADGTRSVTEKGTAGFPGTKGKKTTVEKTKFKYWEFESCLGFTARATAWASGTQADHVGVPRATHCDSFAAGSTFSKDTTTAWTFSGGVDMAKVIGINLSSQTGYDVTASISYAFANRTYLCGKNGDPGDSPGLLVAGLPSKRG